MLETEAMLQAPVPEGYGRDEGAVVVTRDLTKVYRLALGHEITALDHLNLDVYRGEIFGIIGPNGSGKTTTLKLLLGLIFPTDGWALVLGEDPRSTRAKRRIGFMPEGPFFYEYMNGVEVVRFFGSLSGVPKAELKERVNDLLHQVGMWARRDVTMGKCSKGMVQRIGLAAALVSNPDLIMMDEPTSGLDPIGAREIRDLIVQLRDQGKTVLLCSHLLEQVEEICDRVGILHRGQLLRCGSLDEILAPTQESEVVVEAQDPDRLAALSPDGVRVEREGRKLRFIVPPTVPLFSVLDVVRSDGGQLMSVSRFREPLEKVFVRAVSEVAPEEVMEEERILQ